MVGLPEAMVDVLGLHKPDSHLEYWESPFHEFLSIWKLLLYTVPEMYQGAFLWIKVSQTQGLYAGQTRYSR